jgi:hypothetical protein
MEDESTLILLNNTSYALNSREARQLQGKLNGSNWVYKTNHNPDGSTWCKARPIIKRYELSHFSETYAHIGKLNTFRYLISLIGKYGTRWIMDNSNVVNAFLNPKIDDDDIYMTLPGELPEGSNPPRIVVRLRKALYGLTQALRLSHDDINAFLLSPAFTQFLAHPNLYFRSDDIMRQL